MGGYHLIAREKSVENERVPLVEYYREVSVTVTTTTKRMIQMSTTERRAQRH